MEKDNVGKRYTLDGLPDEMLKELKRPSRKNSRDEKLLELLTNLYGGAASIDELWVGLFRQTGENIERRLIGASIRRLVSDKRIYQIPKRKGCYATQAWLDAHK